MQYLDLVVNSVFSRVTQTKLNWYSRNDKPTIITIMANLKNVP